ncbi:hypothetical protein PENSPDRAFT_754350 [Peniophora sp. CONT]|nr:hypothetical protein PENSPDRAFT_754350 [Peniophora sp. CONT]
MDSTADEVTAKYAVAFDRLLFANLGLYAWEYITHLDHDWHLVRGAWPWQWPLTAWAYLICRNATLLSVITSATTVGNVPCDSIVVRLSYFFPYPLLLSAACLMAARAIAIWSRAPWVIVTTTLGLMAHLSVEIYATVVLHVGTVYLPGNLAYACVDLGPKHGSGVKVAVTTNYVVDMFFLSIIFLGLWRHREARFAGLLRILWTQSFMLLLLAVVVTGIPLLILAWVDVNDTILAMGLAIGCLLVGLGTTRMTRALYNTPVVHMAPDAAPTTLPGAHELTTISIPEASSSHPSSLHFSRFDKGESISSLEASSTCASSSKRPDRLH